MKKKIDHLFSRLPLLLQYVLKPLLLTFVVCLALGGFVYAILALTGAYNKIENALDLKANSPWITIPLYAALIGAVLSFLVGFLMYFHKYKRTVPKTKFREQYAALMTGEKKKLEIRK